MMEGMNREELRAVQAPLKERYENEPEAALVTLAATGTLGEGVSCSVETGRAVAAAGLHPASGGDGTLLCSGDILLEALAACAGVTLRAVATSLADLQDAQLGVQIGTTSLDAAEAEIDPSSQPQVFNSSNDVVTALKNETIDAVVVDLPTALYITAAQVPSATVVGQFPAPGGDRWGALLAKDSPLTACVSDAIDELRSSGELERLTQRWMSQAAGAPLLR